MQLASMPRGRRSSSPPPSSMLDGFYQHYGLEDCIAFVARSLQRAGLREDDLAPYQISILRDLPEPLNERRLAAMFSYWDYDIPRLLERGRGWQRDIPAKPKIEVFLEITSKGNFKAEWWPAGYTSNGLRISADGSDFVRWIPDLYRSSGFDRPDNELFFIRGVDMAVERVRHSPNPASIHALSHVFLAACARVVERLKERLDYHFDVQWITDLHVEWQKGERGAGDTPWRPGPPTIVGWRIVNLAEEQERQEAQKTAAELDELADMEARLGFPETALIVALETESARIRPSGPAPSPASLPRRLRAHLAKQGYAVTEAPIRRALELIDKHRPKPVERRENVVPFRK